LVAKPNDTNDKDGVTVTKGLRTVPPGLKRGLRLSAEKNRDPTSSELHDLDEHENEAESPVTNVLLVLVALCAHSLATARSTRRRAGRATYAGSFARSTYRR